MTTAWRFTKADRRGSLADRVDGVAVV